MSETTVENHCYPAAHPLLFSELLYPSLPLSWPFFSFYHRVGLSCRLCLGLCFCFYHRGGSCRATTEIFSTTTIRFCGNSKNPLLRNLIQAGTANATEIRCIVLGHQSLRGLAAGRLNPRAADTLFNSQLLIQRTIFAAGEIRMRQRRVETRSPNYRRRRREHTHSLSHFC